MNFATEKFCSMHEAATHYTKFVYIDSLSDCLDEGLIEMCTPPDWIGEMSWPVESRFYTITEKGQTILEYNAL